MIDIKPLGNRVLIKRDPTITHSEGGVALPRQAQKLPEAGTALRVGPGERLKNGRMKTPEVSEGDHVLFTETGNPPVMLNEEECVLIDGVHIFAKGIDSYPMFKFNDVTIGFDHVALRDLMFILPTKPPTMLGEKGLIESPVSFQKRHQNYTGLLLSSGPGFLSAKTGLYQPTDDRLRPGTIVKFDLSVPWCIYVKDTNGKDHYVTVCGSSDIYGILSYIEQE